MRNALILFFCTLQCFGSPAFAGAAQGRAYQSETLSLRAGTITLEPTQAPSTAADQPPERRTESLRSARGRSLEPETGAAPQTARPAARVPTGDRGIADNNARTSDEAVPISRALASNRVILSFERRVTEDERKKLARNGIEVGLFLGGTVYSARIQQTNSDALVRASEGINPIQKVAALDESNAHIKIDPSLLRSLAAPRAVARGLEPADRAARAPSAVRPGALVIQLWPDVDIEQVKSQLAALGRIIRVSPLTRKIEMSVAHLEIVRDIAKLKGVQYVAHAYELKSQNTHIRRNIGMDAVTGPLRLTGRGVRVGLWDGGHVAVNHPSFMARLSVDLAREGVARHDSRHATHVAGTIAGSGLYVPLAVASDPTAPMSESTLPGFGDELTPRATPPPAPIAPPAVADETTDQVEARYPGIADAATIVSFDFNGAAEELISLLMDKPDAIDVVNNSWGLDLNPETNPTSCGQLGSYAVLDAAAFDAVVSGDVDGATIRRVPILFAAGNVRNDGICGLSNAEGYPNYRTVIPPATAKNVITVGAIDADDNGMTAFSDWGPTANGRIKPDVVAPGCRKLADGEQGIMSAVPEESIGRSCGTSMATPAVTGVVALMIEEMTKLNFNKADVFPSTYKALLIQGAEDLGRPGPDYEFGYGAVRVAPTLKLMQDHAFHQERAQQEGDLKSRDITVPPHAASIKVTLVWDDRPTGILSDEALSNDLDLALVSPDGEGHLPFVLNTAVGAEKEYPTMAADHVNVVEQVLVKQPGAGVWRIEVRARKIGSPTGGQTYSLVAAIQ